MCNVKVFFCSNKPTDNLPNFEVSLSSTALLFWFSYTSRTNQSHLQQVANIVPENVQAQ